MYSRNQDVSPFNKEARGCRLNEGRAARGAEKRRLLVVTSVERNGKPRLAAQREAGRL